MKRKETSKEVGNYGGLRGWIEQVERLGELLRVSGAHWDTEMGAITHMLTEKSRGNAPKAIPNFCGYLFYRLTIGRNMRPIGLPTGSPSRI